MKKSRYYYLVRIQYLGFRYSGWQKQPKHKTLEEMVAKTIKFILPGQKFKVLGAGRTDAKVSALDMAFELFLDHRPIPNLPEFLAVFNNNLPPDIRALFIKEVDSTFNIIQHAKTKEYVYLFSFGAKNHPFCAPFMANFQDELDIGLMKTAARLYEGTHNFQAYTARPKGNTQVRRSIDYCEIKPNMVLTGNFFPEESFALYVVGKGFMRYQIRMIMGALVQLGRGELTMEDIKNSIRENNTVRLTSVAPGSGLLLHHLEFEPHS